MVELGYGIAYRVLDAQHFGVPQRRRRVFVVGYLGDWRCAAAVLFERESLRGDSAPRREARKDVAPTISARTSGGGGLGTDFDLDGGLVQGHIAPTLTGNPYGDNEGREGLLLAFGGNRQTGPLDVATAVNACHTASGRQDFETETFITHALTGNGFDASEDETGRGTPLVPVAFPSRIAHSAVRRLTPTECERLQGFHDGWTDVPYRGKPAADGPRYRSLGNSMAVPVMEWIGRRIQMVENIR